MKRSKITLEDVAKQFNCSPSTVSRALNDKPGISEKLKSEIRIAAMNLGYDIQKAIKPSKVKKQADVRRISVVVSRDNFTDENFHRKIICEIEQIIYKKKIETNFFIMDRNTVTGIDGMLRRLKPDGVILFGLLSNQSVTEAVYSGIPTVLVDIPNLHLKADRITVNNYLGCFEAVTYLMNQGHRRISFFGDESFSDNMMERYNGCRKCVEKNDGRWVEAKNLFRIELSGNVIVNEARFYELMRSEERPTAVVCGNDKIAFLVYELAAKANLKIPDDLSVVGFDNVDRCEFLSPPLTSVNVPKFEMGTEAVRILLERIANPARVTALYQLDTNLVIRESVKKIDGPSR